MLPFLQLTSYYTYILNYECGKKCMWISDFITKSSYYLTYLPFPAIIRLNCYTLFSWVFLSLHCVSMKGYIPLYDRVNITTYGSPQSWLSDSYTCISITREHFDLWDWAWLYGFSLLKLCDSPDHTMNAWSEEQWQLLDDWNRVKTNSWSSGTGDE